MAEAKFGSALAVRDPALIHSCRSHAHLGTPRIARRERAAFHAFRREAPLAQAFGRRRHARLVRQLDGPREQARVVIARGLRARARPGVGAEVVVVAARAEEERAGVVPYG